MWRFKFLLIGMLISGALGAGIFLVGRYVFDQFKAELEDDAIAAVDDYFATSKPAPITEERVVITERELTQALQDTDELTSTFDQQGLEIDLVPGEIRIVDADREGDGTTLASVSPTIVNAEIELGEPDGVVAIFVPMGTIADEIESQLLSYFNVSQVIPTSIEVTDQELILTVAPKPGTTLGGNATPRATPQAGARTPTPSATTPRTPTPTATTTATETRVVRTTPTGTVPTARTPPPAAGARTSTAQPTATRASVLGIPRTPTPTP